MVSQGVRYETRHADARLGCPSMLSSLAVAVGGVGRCLRGSICTAGEPKVQRLIFVSAGFNESNRFWTITRPHHLQFDPFLETLLDLDPKTGEYIPRLAEKWQSSPDQKEWTFYSARVCRSTSGMASSPPRMSSIPTPSCCVKRPSRRWWLLAECGGGEGHRRLPGRLPHEEPGSHHALCRLPLRRSADRQQGPVG